MIVTGCDQDRLGAATQALSGVHIFRSDVSDPTAIAALYEAVLSDFPALDTLISNAGIMRNLKFNEARDLEDVTREIEINLNGPVRMVQQFLPPLRGRPGALIVKVLSGLAFIRFPAAPVYCAAKAGPHSFTQSLRIQFQGTGVTVVELAPPGVETPLLRGEFAEEMQGQKAMRPWRAPHRHNVTILQPTRPPPLPLGSGPKAAHQSSRTRQSPMLDRSPHTSVVLPRGSIHRRSPPAGTAPARCTASRNAPGPGHPSVVQRA